MTETSPWTSGLNAPIDHEVEAFDLAVDGDLPADLCGRYLRNGPNPIGPADPTRHHWFLGDPMVHGIRLRDGRAEWYRARWVRTNAVSEALGEPAAPGERFGGMDTANTSVVAIGGAPHAVVEAGARPVELADDLSTVRHSDLGGTLAHGYTAHPKLDPATGILHAVNYHWAVPGVEYVTIGPDGRVIATEHIDVDDGPMIHDCAITERWLVVFDLPVTFSMDAVASGAMFPYLWNDAHPSRIGLVPLSGSGSEVRWFDVDPCYVFHPVNAYDDGAALVLDVIRYERMFDAVPLGPDETAPLWWRWRVDLITGTVREEQISDVGLEFPRVDERVVGRRHSVAWASEVARADDHNHFGGRPVRLDSATGHVRLIETGPGHRSGEWVMVPREASASETDGWLLSYAYDPSTDRSHLAVLAADAPEDGPVARVHLPTRVPVGFHGNWFADPA